MTVQDAPPPAPSAPNVQHATAVAAPGAGVSNVVAVALSSFMVRLEEPGIEPQASESTFYWESAFPREPPVTLPSAPRAVIWLEPGAVCDVDGVAVTASVAATTPVTWVLPRDGNWVELALDAGPRLIVGHHDNGLFSSLAPVNTVTSATVVGAIRIGPHRENVRWRLASGGDVPFSRGVEHKVELSTRLRMSVWTFNAPFILDTIPENDKDPAKVILDDGLIQLLKEARIDDLSLVPTIIFDKSTGGVTWAKSYNPVPKHPEFRGPYLHALVERLHAIKVQVLGGYYYVKRSAAKNWKDMTEGERAAEATRCEPFRDFANWLLNASFREIGYHAVEIDAFCAKFGLDGIGFDFEFDELKEAHREKLAYLYRTTAKLLAQRNGIVSYANLPFKKKDGKEGHEFIRIQPYSLTRQTPNLIARPMCFDGVTSRTPAEIEASIKCALSEADEEGGAGLHPSQVQFGIWAGKIDGGVGSLCRKFLRPNRVGMILYNLPFPKDTKGTYAAQEAFFKNCIQWDKALNPDEAAPGAVGQPLQVPRSPEPLQPRKVIEPEVAGQPGDFGQPGEVDQPLQVPC